MRNRPFEFNILVVYLKWTKIVEVDENCRFIIKFLKEVNDLWRKKFKLSNKGTNCLLSIENKYQNIVLRFIHLWRHIRKPVKWTKTADVALYILTWFRLKIKWWCPEMLFWIQKFVWWAFRFSSSDWSRFMSASSENLTKTIGW